MSLSWHAPQYMHTHKTTDWYWIVGIVSVTLALIAIFFDNTMFGVLIIIGTATLTLFSSRPPKYIFAEILSSGVKIDDIFYPYSHLESFWIEETQLAPRILLKTSKKIAPYVIILLGDAHPEDVRHEMLAYLPEVKHSEPFLEKLLIYFGF